MHRIIGLCLFVLFLNAAASRADILCLNDGRILTGPPMERKDGGVEVRFENGTVFVPDSLIMEAIVAGIADFIPTTDFEKKQVEKGLVPYQGRWVSPAKRDREVKKRLEKQRAAIAEEEAYRVWRNRRCEKTKHFEFEYTVPQHIYEHVRDLMETDFKSFAGEWNIRQPKKHGRLKVCFYKDREKFAQIGGAPGAAGYFRYSFPMELNFYYDRFDPEFTEDVMFHETNHYLTKLIDLDFHFPHFPGESLAEYYGASDYDTESKRIITGLIQEGRLIQIQDDITVGNMMTLKKLIQTERMYQHYNWGWSLVHFLMNDPRYQKKFQKFVIGLAKGKDVDRISAGDLEMVRGTEIYRAFKKYMGLKKEEDVTRLEEEWYEYVIKELELVSVRGKEKAAVDAMNTNPPRSIRAKRLFREAIDEGSENPLTFHKYAELLDKEDEHGEAVRMWQRAIALDPLNPHFHGQLGSALAEHGNRDEGARLMQLAIEIDPEYERSSNRPSSLACATPSRSKTVNVPFIVTSSVLSLFSVAFSSPMFRITPSDSIFSITGNSLFSSRFSSSASGSTTLSGIETALSSASREDPSINQAKPISKVAITRMPEMKITELFPRMTLLLITGNHRSFVHRSIL